MHKFRGSGEGSDPINITSYFSQSFHLNFSKLTSTVNTTLRKAISMEGQGRNISHTSDTQVASQAQMRNDENMHQGSKNTAQDTNFLQETGEGVKSMGQGAATMTQGAVHGAASIVQGAAAGVGKITGGTASAVKNTLGAKNDTTTKDSGKSKY